MRQIGLFGDGQRLQMNESIELTIDILRELAAQHEHWAFAWSGGKDSTTLLTLAIWMIDADKVQRPKTITVFYADTRMELAPLQLVAQDLIYDLRERGIDVRVVMAPLEKRFWPYMLGRGVPPPNNGTLRWCTRQIKIDPMIAELRKLDEDLGLLARRQPLMQAADEERARRNVATRALRDLGDAAPPEWLVDGIASLDRAIEDLERDANRFKILMLTGVRVGESAARDRRIESACSRDGGECGQGRYHNDSPSDIVITRSPIIHWRVCHVWEWLKHWAPLPDFGDWSTALLAEAYGGDEAEEVNARFGCIKCPLVQEDRTFARVAALPAWSHLAPLHRLDQVFARLREPSARLRQPGIELLQDGTPGKNPQRMGPIRLEVRLWALDQVLAIQAECNELARAAGRPFIDIIDAEEEARIRDLIAAGTWPQGWTGDEPTGDELLDKVFADGSVQPLLPMFGTKEGA